MNAVCPACSVAVVPGYVRCPKCRAGLPFEPTRTARSAGDPGGTALAHKGFPVSAVILAVAVAVAIILVFGVFGVFGVRSGGTKTEAAPAPPPGPIEAVTPSPGPRGVVPAVVQAPAPAAPEIAPDLAAADLEDTLRRQRLWGRAVITGPGIDVRSGSCADPAMRSIVESKQPLLHGAGLTKLRCLEQSGAVVFERDL